VKASRGKLLSRLGRWLLAKCEGWFLVRLGRRLLAKFGRYLFFGLGFGQA